MFVAYTIRRNKYIASNPHPTREDAARELFTALPKLQRCTTKHAETGADVQWINRDLVTLDAVKASFGHEDTKRALAAAQAIIGGRLRAYAEPAQIMVTLEHTVATVLIALYGDPRIAVGMLNEALIPGVERRLAFYGSKDKRDA
jgi:hypothetical protein